MESRFMMDPDEYIVRSGTGRKFRHRPLSADEDKPACRVDTKKDDTKWNRKDARHTIFHDDCNHCFYGKS